jgi:predicted nucleic acid-binding protein
MPGYFLDTSALVKHYHAEAGTAEVDRLWNDASQDLFLSRLGAVEMLSAFAGKVRTGTITAADFEVLRRRFWADLTKKKRPQSVRMLADHFREAERLLRRHGLAVRLRTLDALQLAVALHLQARGLITHFACADRNLLAIASSEGLAVLDPEHP